MRRAFAEALGPCHPSRSAIPGRVAPGAPTQDDRLPSPPAPFETLAPRRLAPYRASPSRAGCRGSGCVGEVVVRRRVFALIATGALAGIIEWQMSAACLRLLQIGRASCRERV